jgi:acyl-CoA synthetase (NDP forming)
MRGFRHRSLHVEVKHRLGSAGALLREPPPAGIAGARRAVAHHALAHEIDISVIVVGRPMALEIVEEGGQSGFRPCTSK